MSERELLDPIIADILTKLKEEPNSTNNLSGRNYIVYSLSKKGIQMELLINKYLQQVNVF